MPPLDMTGLAMLLADETKKGLVKHKAETAKEMKAMIAGLVADALGTGTPGYKALSDLIEKEIQLRVPTSSLFMDDKGKGQSYEGTGLQGMNKKAIDDLALRTLFAVTPRELRAEMPMFSGKDAKALSIGLGSSGGYLLPEEFVAEVQRKLVHTSVFLGQCRIWSGVEMIGKMPRETGTVSVTIAGELVTPGNTQFSLGNVTWALQKRMGLTNLPQELWKHSGIDVINLLSTMFAEQFQKTEDYLYLLGSGSQQPMGLLTQQTGMNTLAISSSTTQWQDYLRLKHAIKSQYRLEKGNCAFMLNNDTIERAGGLTDDNNRPIFLDRGAEGMGGPNIPPQTVGFILGQPVLENPYMPGPVSENAAGTTTSTANTATGVFANLKRGYGAFKGQAMETKSSDVAYDAFLNDGLYVRAIDEIDGKPLIPEAVAILTGMA